MKKRLCAIQFAEVAEMKKAFLCMLVIVVLMSGLAACAQPDDVLPEEVTIQTDRDVYIPIMSSAVGIGLTPVYTLERPLETVQLHWRTDYGYFVAWDSPDFKVNLLGTEVINNGEKIYWSYDPGEMGAEKPSVEISLQIEDAQSGQVLAEASLKIGWEDQDTARVISHMESPRELTDNEKDRVIEIALNTPEALRQLESESAFTTQIRWVAILSEAPVSGFWQIDYDWKTDDNFENVPAAATWYPEVLIRFGDPQQWQVMVAVDLDTGEVVHVQENPAQKGPQAVTLEDKGWVLESYGEQGNLQSVLEGTEITAIFDSSQGQVHGSAGCNTYYADYMLNNNNISFPQIAHTEMACLEPEGVMQQEEQYLKVLQDAESYQIQDGKLQINCGAQILVFAAQEE